MSVFDFLSPNFINYILHRFLSGFINIRDFHKTGSIWFLMLVQFFNPWNILTCWSTKNLKQSKSIQPMKVNTNENISWTNNKVP
jgi:hypothetical protein